MDVNACQTGLVISIARSTSKMGAVFLTLANMVMSAFDTSEQSPRVFCRDVAVAHWPTG